jgi:hypothetical protein
MVEVLRMHWNVASTPNRALIPITAQVVGAALWMALATAVLVRALAGVAGGVIGAGSLAPVAASDWYVLLLWTIGLFGLQTSVAALFDGTYAAGGWRVLPLFLVFPLYFWLVIYPSFLLGALRGLASPGSSRWSRTERSPVRDTVVARSTSRPR